MAMETGAIGLGAAFVASQIASLTGVAERESGLAAGLVDSAFHVGSALGIAIGLIVMAGSYLLLAGR